MSDSTGRNHRNLSSARFVIGFVIFLVFLFAIKGFIDTLFPPSTNTPTSTPLFQLTIDPLPIVFAIVIGSLFLALININRELKRRKRKETYPRDSIIKILSKRKSRSVYISVVLCLLILILSFIVPKLENVPEVFPIRIALFLISILLLFGKLVLEYRILKGWYGNNEREAREIIEFIIKESSNIDFRDGGKLKKILSDEDIEEIKLLGMQPVLGTD